jgi:putative SOS response-associated peptidase YedK
MCGRFTLTWEEWRQVAGALGVEDEVDAFADYRPRFNIAPTDQHFIITSEFERRKAQRARWGLVNRWARDNSRASQCINAKAETLEHRPTFSEAFQERRCVVPADAFYEWVRREVACVIVRRHHPAEPAVPSAVSYEVGRFGNGLSKSPRTMYPSVARRVSVPRGKEASASIEAERG